MIIVKNRELLIPNNERYIGTTYDNDTENRAFQVPRFSQRGVDLANLTFRLDIQYANESYDTVVLDKEVGEAFIILIWRITSATLQVPGTLYIGLRAIDDEATVKWSSFSAAMYAERHLNTPGNYGGSLTEIEQMEQDHQYMKNVINELKDNLDYAHDAEAWAQGTRSGTAVPSTDKTYHNNSKYYADQANTKATAAANSATQAANSATQAAETVSDTNARFNNAVKAVTSETEVIDARVGADGTTYPVLKTRLDTEHTQLKSAISVISENKENLYGIDLVRLGKNWTGGSASNRAVAYVPVEPSTTYFAQIPINAHISEVQVIEKAQNTGASSNLHLTKIVGGNKAIITTTANTHYFCLQFDGTTTLASSDFTNYSVYVCEGSTALFSAVDKVARSDAGKALHDVVSVTESYNNYIGFDDLQIGRDYTGGSNALRAVLYVAVEPSTEYYLLVPPNDAFNDLSVIEKAANSGSSAAIIIHKIYNDSVQTITTSATTKYFCIQFNARAALTESDFEDYPLYLTNGDEIDLSAVDKVARKASYDTFYDIAKAKAKGVVRVGGYELRNITKNVKVYNHQQDAHTNAPYYDVNGTVEEYSSINYNHKLPNENILNYLPQNEIDFTPQNNGFTRIIVGKNSNDLFFVAYMASNRAGTFGDAKYDALEVTSDFVNFRTILRSDALETGDGIPVPGMTNLKVDRVKEFADGSYVVAIRCHNIADNNDYTHFYNMASDFSEINHCYYQNFNGDTVLMIDEFGSNVYDWSIFIAGEKGLATTYGNRNPQTDYGRVWYTENNGHSWKQVFQTNNHLQEGQAAGVTVTEAHTHGVMIDIINHVTTRLFVIVGENNRNIFWTDKGYNATDNDWNVIDIKNQPFYNFQTFTQVVNGYPFKDGLVFGSDNEGVGCVYRINKLDDGTYSRIEPAHEFLPNKWNGTYYCAAEMSRRDFDSPLLMCETHENCMFTEEDNELLNEYHKARVVATYDGINFMEIWSDDTYGPHDVFIDSNLVTRKYSYCSRGMNCWLLKNGDAVIKYVGRDYYYFGGNPMFSVTGVSNGSCKVRWIKNAEKYL